MSEDFTLDLGDLEGHDNGAPEDGKIPCAHCGKLFAPSGKHRKYHSTACRKAADKEREKAREAARRASGGTKATGGGAPKHSRSMWLVRKEAEIIGYIIQFFAARRAGLQLKPPGEGRREHLAQVLKKLEKQPPFSYLQQALYRVFPVFDPEAKPGRSTFGDAAQYAWGWYEENPELQAALGDAIPPFLRGEPEPAEAPQGGPEGVEHREPMSYEEWQALYTERTPAAARAPEGSEATE